MSEDKLYDLKVLGFGMMAGAFLYHTIIYFACGDFPTLIKPHFKKELRDHSRVILAKEQFNSFSDDTNKRLEKTDTAYFLVPASQLSLK